MKLVIILSGMLFLFAGCKKREAEVAEQNQEVEIIGAPVARPKLTLPVQRTIIGKDGRKLEVMIVKRTANSIKIVRNSDQKTFDLAIDKLSDVDQGFVKKLPLSKEVVKSKVSPRLENRQKELRKLEENMRDYENELASGALNSSQSSIVRGKMQRLMPEILKLRQDIQKLGREAQSGGYEKKGSSGTY